MPINPQLLALLAQKAGTGDVDQLATLLSKEVPQGPPPTTAPPPQQPFPVSPRGGGIPQGIGGSRPAPPQIPPAAPQALAAASNQSALGGGIPAGGGGVDIGKIVQAALPLVLGAVGGGGGGGAGAGAGAGALGGLFGGGAGAGAGSSAGPALAGGLPNGAAAGAAGGVNPLEALVAPTPGQEQRPQQPRAIAPRPGGQINPQILQMILQALQAGGGQPQQQSLGAILGGLR